MILARKYFLSVSVCTCVLLAYLSYNSCAVMKNEALEKKVRQMMDLSNRRSVVRLDSGKFSSYVKSTPRNYSTVVMFTALQSHRECAVCREASGEYEIVANSWRHSPGFSNRLFFAMVDYDDAPDVFSMLGLNSAPFFIHFPPKGKHKRADILDINRVGFFAESLVKFVSERAAVQMELYRPPNYLNITLVVLLVTFISLIIYAKRDNLEFFQNKSAWACATLCIILAMTSGQMWNHIRGAPLVSKNHQNGQIEYIHPWSDSQLIAETYIVCALNIVVVIGMILLSNASTVKTAVGKKRVIALCGIGSVAVFFSLLLSVFRSKYQGYPYSFLFS